MMGSKDSAGKGLNNEEGLDGRENDMKENEDNGGNNTKEEKKSSSLMLLFCKS
jgi:hypothetical protein